MDTTGSLLSAHPSTAEESGASLARLISATALPEHGVGNLPYPISQAYSRVRYSIVLEPAKVGGLAASAGAQRCPSRPMLCSQRRANRGQLEHRWCVRLGSDRAKRARRFHAGASALARNLDHALLQRAGLHAESVKW